MVRQIQERDMTVYYTVCPPWRLEAYQDRTGSWNLDCVVFGAEKEDGTPQGLLLLQKTGEREYEIGVLSCNMLTQSLTASELLQMAEGYVAVCGGGRLRYDYMTSYPETVDQIVLQRLWKRPEEIAVVYQIRGDSLQFQRKDSVTLSGKLKPFVEVPLSEQIRFAGRFGQDIESYLDYRLCDDMDEELSLAYLADGQMKGYLLTRTWGDTLEINRFYVEPEYRGCFGVMVQRLYEQYRKHQPVFRRICVCAANETSKKLIQHMLGDGIMEQQYVKRAEVYIRQAE